MLLITSFLLLLPRSSVDTVEARNRLCKAPKARDLQRRGGATKDLQRSDGVARDLQHRGGTTEANNPQEKADLHHTDKTRDLHRNTTTYDAQLGSFGRREGAREPQEAAENGEELHPAGTKAEKKRTKEELHRNGKARDLHRINRKSGAPLVTARYTHLRSRGRK